MIGKKNIVFGFLYLVLTAALGPMMIIKYFDDVGATEAVKQQKVGALQQAAASGFEVDLEPMTADEIAAMNADAILALSAHLNSEGPINAVKGGPHTHGNLEALLNIAAGFLICFLAVHRTLKQLISWSFLLGAVAHSGLLYLAIGLNVGWALSLMGTPFAYLGPALILIGLLLAGVAAALGFRGTIETDF